jgi:iron(III) transport system permease protein
MPGSRCPTTSLDEGPRPLFSQQDSATGILQAFRFGRWWLIGPLLGMLVVAAAFFVASERRQAYMFVLGGALGAGLLLLAGFTIGIQGWSLPLMKALLPALPQGQYGLGYGGILVLLSLLMIFGLGLARLGYFRGDGFTSCAVIFTASLLLLFIAFPVSKALISALQDDAGRWSLSASAERLFNEKIWGLGCLRRRRPLRRGLEHAVPRYRVRRGFDAARPRAGAPC